ncbi:MAG: hypothetical protein IKI05_03120 [Bacteroidaceae bacterium]|nr:hypothetical protein [Bacteroidaceae bacterium]
MPQLIPRTAAQFVSLAQIESHSQPSTAYFASVVDTNTQVFTYLCANIYKLTAKQHTATA